MERSQNTQMTSRLCTLQGVPTALGAVLLLFVTAVLPGTGIGRFIDMACYSEKLYSLRCFWQVSEHTASPSHFTLFYNSSLNQCHPCKGIRQDITPSTGANFYCDFPEEYAIYFVPITITLVTTTPSCSRANADQSEQGFPHLQDLIHQPDNYVEPCDLSAHTEIPLKQNDKKELQYNAHGQSTPQNELDNYYYDHERQSATYRTPLPSRKVMHNLIREPKDFMTTPEASINCSPTTQMLHRLTFRLERHMRVREPRRLQVQQNGGVQKVVKQGVLWVSWQEPDTDGLGSKVEYRLHFGPVNATSHTELVMKETQLNLTDLRPAQPYWFRVSARPDGRSFSGPWSPWSPDSIATPPLVTGDPDLKCFTSDILHLKCHWKVNASLPTITFTVNYRTRSSQGLCRDILMFHGTKRLEYTCQFSVLQPENNDSQNVDLTIEDKTWVEVVLHGESVAGQHTVILSPFILQYAVMPDAPQDVQAMPGVHQGELKVLWNPPSEFLAPHLQYQLRHRREKHTWQLLSVTHGRSRLLYGLSPGEKYQVSVRALPATLSLQGTWGSWSEEVTGQVSRGLTISMWIYYALGTLTALLVICFCFHKIQARLKIWLWRPLPSLHQSFPGHSGVDGDVQAWLASIPETPTWALNTGHPLEEIKPCMVEVVRETLSIRLSEKLKSDMETKNEGFIENVEMWEEIQGKEEVWRWNIAESLGKSQSWEDREPKECSSRGHHDEWQKIEHWVEKVWVEKQWNYGQQKDNREITLGTRDSLLSDVSVDSGVLDSNASENSTGSCITGTLLSKTGNPESSLYPPSLPMDVLNLSLTPTNSWNGYLLLPEAEQAREIASNITYANMSYQPVIQTPGAANGPFATVGSK